MIDESIQNKKKKTGLCSKASKRFFLEDPMMNPF